MASRAEWILYYAKLIAAALCLFAAVTGIAGWLATFAHETTYTLYRNSVLDRRARVHVATFDVQAREEYNRENCVNAAVLLRAQPLVTTTFWCEAGRFKK